MKVIKSYESYKKLWKVSYLRENCSVSSNFSITIGCCSVNTMITIIILVVNNANLFMIWIIYWSNNIWWHIIMVKSINLLWINDKICQAKLMFTWCPRWRVVCRLNKRPDGRNCWHWWISCSFEQIRLNNCWTETG